jgi:hypothetical protein
MALAIALIGSYKDRTDSRNPRIAFNLLLFYSGIYSNP